MKEEQVASSATEPSHGFCWNIKGYGFKLRYLGDGAHSFCASFPKHQFLVTVQVLGRLDEAEVDCGLVPRP